MRHELKARFVEARRWHAFAVTALDVIIREMADRMRQESTYEHIDVVEEAEADAAPYLAGCPGEAGAWVDPDQPPKPDPATARMQGSAPARGRGENAGVVSHRLPGCALRKNGDTKLMGA